MKYLLLDVCRCEGVGCDVKDKCLRHTELKNLGPRTPVSMRLCDGGTTEKFYPAYDNDSDDSDMRVRS